MLKVCHRLSASYRSAHFLSVRSQQRFLSIDTEAIVYSSYGIPEEVVESKKTTVDFDESSVLLSMLAAPINPADINQLEGLYALLPPLPAIGGNEGVAKVEKIGHNAKTNLKVGDWVIPTQAGWGTWRSKAVCNPDDLQRIPNDISVGDAACLSVNPCTAYRMLRDFVSLSPGDYVIQNGATSGVGRAVIQIAAASGINTINIIRDRATEEELNDTVNTLKALGATHVYSESQAQSSKEPTDFSKMMKSLSQKPKIAFNCVGGHSSKTLMHNLPEKGVMVTYGGMSKRPPLVSTAALIFKDLNIRGFWMSRWIKENSKEKRSEMLEELADMIKNKKLSFDYTFWNYKDYKEAIRASTSGKKSLTKQVLSFNEEK